MNHEESKDKPRIHLGAYALCIDSSDRLLLCRMSTGCTDQGSWTLPGGGLQWGETPDAAVARELLEETGLSPREMTLSGSVYSEVYSQPEERPADAVHHVGILYRVYGTSGTLRPENAGTTDQCAWFSREEAEELLLTSLGRFALGIAWPDEEKGSYAQGASPALGIKHQRTPGILSHDTGNECVLQTVPQAPERPYFCDS